MLHCYILKIKIYKNSWFAYLIKMLCEHPMLGGLDKLKILNLSHQLIFTTTEEE